MLERRRSSARRRLSRRRTAISATRKTHSTIPPTNHHCRQNGRSIVKRRTAGAELTTPREVTARAIKVYVPGASEAKTNERLFRGGRHSSSAPISLYWYSRLFSSRRLIPATSMEQLSWSFESSNAPVVG